MPSRMLRIAALVELASLALLLINLATVHWPPVASLLGPIHGCAYLFVIGCTIHESKNPTTRLLAFVPGIGGLLTTRRLTTPAPHRPQSQSGLSLPQADDLNHPS